MILSNKRFKKALIRLRGCASWSVPFLFATTKDRATLGSAYVSISIIEPWHEISNNVVCATSKSSDQPAHTRSLIRAFASLNYMSVKLLIEHHLEFLSLKGGCTGSFESTRVKTPHCWKLHVTAHYLVTALTKNL